MNSSMRQKVQKCFERKTGIPTLLRSKIPWICIYFEKSEIIITKVGDDPF